MVVQKTVLITGASKGIGKESAKLFLSKGYKVIGTYNQTIPNINDFGANAKDNLEFKKINFSNTDEIKKFAQSINTPDILINNAGVGTKTVENYSPEPFAQDEALIKINALAPLWLIQELLPQMKQKKAAKIINISSVGGGIFHFAGFRIADGMSKAALTFATKQLAAELVHSSVDIFAICPGATDTEMFNASTLNKLSSKEKENFINSLPKSRLIQPQEIAELCLYLAQDASTILHGAIIDSSLGLGTAPQTIY